MRTILAICALACMVIAPSAQAEAPKPFADFKAKRVKPPKKGTRKRITIQIEPQAQTTAVAAAPKAKTGSGKKSGSIGSFDWFWSSVSPKVADSGPGRLEPALIRLSNPPSGKGVSAPRLQTLQEIAKAQGIEILKSTIGTRVSPALALAVISIESGGRADAVSSAGAQGLMQLMPATAARFGVSDSLSPPQNIKGGVAYLDFLLKKFDDDPILALAGYNAGENAVTKHKGVPPYSETRDYVPKVLAAFQVAKGLCKTPPQLITDGCVFAVSAN